MKRLLLFAAAIAVLWVEPASAGIIDDFSVPSTSTVFTLTTPDTDTVINTNSGLPGGTTRTLSGRISAPPPNFAILFGAFGGGTLQANFGFASTGWVALDYQFATARDFSTDYALEFVAGSIPVSTPALLTIETAGGTMTLNTSLLHSPTMVPVHFRFSDFSGSGDLSQVQRVTARFSGAGGTTLMFDSVASVPTPEPGTLVSFLLAGPALWLAARRKRQ